MRPQTVPIRQVPATRPRLARPWPGQGPVWSGSAFEGPARPSKGLVAPWSGVAVVAVLARPPWVHREKPWPKSGLCSRVHLHEISRKKSEKIETSNFLTGYSGYTGYSLCMAIESLLFVCTRCEKRTGYRPGTPGTDRVQLNFLPSQEARPERVLFRSRRRTGAFPLPLGAGTEPGRFQKEAPPCRAGPDTLFSWSALHKPHF